MAVAITRFVMNRLSFKKVSFTFGRQPPEDLVGQIVEVAGHILSETDFWKKARLSMQIQCIPYV